MTVSTRDNLYYFAETIPLGLRKQCRQSNLHLRVVYRLPASIMHDLCH